MQHTMELLNKALAVAPIPTWTKKLHLTRDAIAGAKGKGYLTPVIAAALAAELGEDVNAWTTAAVLEGAKDSPAKQALLKRLRHMSNL